MELELAIDIAGNRLNVGGTRAFGRHRWEAAVLAMLIKGQHTSATSACGAPKLHETLRGHGQTRPLNRKQLSRLWSGLEEMVDAAGGPGSFAKRLGHPPRGRTVGPWWWVALPGDRIEVVGPRAEAPGQSRLPSIASSAAPEEAAALCQHLLVCQGALIDGRLVEAAEGFGDDTAWRLASPEFHAFRYLRLAETHMQSRAFDRAREAMLKCEALVAGNEVAAIYLGGGVTLARHRLAYYESPTERYAAIANAIAPLVHHAPGARYPEVDRFTRGLMFNLAALCERRWLEQHGQHAGPAASHPHLEAAFRHWLAALFCFATSNQYEHAQNMCANIGYLLHRALMVGLDVRPRAALEWYAVAQVWQNRFDLADNNVWEYVFLGDFWLEVPSARADFRAMASRVAWRGRRPDTLGFYEYALRRAKEIGEPRQMAHTALNLWRFAREHAQLEIAAAARGELRRVLGAHPDVRAILRSEGYSLP